MENFLEKHSIFGYNWEPTYGRYIDVDGNNGEEIVVYTPYVTPHSCERVEITIEKTEDGDYIASTEALSNAMFDLLGEEDWLTNEYLLQLKSDLLNLEIYNQLEECLNTVVYRFDEDKFNFYRLTDMCNYCITIITMIMNYTKYNWGL